MRTVRSQTTFAGAAAGVAVGLGFSLLPARSSGREPAVRRALAAEVSAERSASWQEAGELGEDPLDGPLGQEPPPFIWTVDPPSMPGTEGADWFLAIAKSESFREFGLDAIAAASPDNAAGAGADLFLTWQIADLGPAIVDDAGTVDTEGHHDQRPALVIGWRGRSTTVPLDDTWNHVDLSSYCDRAKESRHPQAPLSSFALSSYRGDVTYEVYRAPHALVVIQDDTSPLDWMPGCHEIKQGPYTTCLETAWVRYAVVSIDLEADASLAVRERVQERETNGRWHDRVCE